MVDIDSSVIYLCLNSVQKGQQTLMLYTKQRRGLVLFFPHDSERTLILTSPELNQIVKHANTIVALHALQYDS